MNAIFQFPDSSKGSDFLTNSVIHKQKPQEGTPLHHYNVYRIWIWPKIFFSNLHTFSSEVNGQYSEEGRLNESSVVSWVPNVAVTVLPASIAYHEPRLNPEFWVKMAHFWNLMLKMGTFSNYYSKWPLWCHVGATSLKNIFFHHYSESRNWETRFHFCTKTAIVTRGFIFVLKPQLVNAVSFLY